MKKADESQGKKYNNEKKTVDWKEPMVTFEKDVNANI